MYFKFISHSPLSTPQGLNNHITTHVSRIQKIEDPAKKQAEKNQFIRSLPNSLKALLYPYISRSDGYIGQLNPVSPGAGKGKLVFEGEKSLPDENFIFVCKEHDSRYINLLFNPHCKGMICGKTGAGTHLKIITSSIGTPLLSGKVGDGTLQIGNRTVTQGQTLCIDGSSGNVYSEKAAVTYPEITEAFQTLLQWLKEDAPLSVHANAESDYIHLAKQYGAANHALSRSEHEFFDPHSLPVLQQALFSDNPDTRKACLNLLEKHFTDKVKTLKTAYPEATIRLFDPPSQEFLPKNHKETFPRVETETNPDMGCRGIRLLFDPKQQPLIKMQIRSIFTAAKELNQPSVSINIPMISDVKELEKTLKHVAGIAKEFPGITPNIVATIETPSAALQTKQLLEARDPDIGDQLKVNEITYSTNDLTSFTMARSRSDYRPKKGEENCFKTLTQSVKMLIKISLAALREYETKHSVRIPVSCGGEQAKNDLDFFLREGFPKVAASPLSIPDMLLKIAKMTIEKEHPRPKL